MLLTAGERISMSLMSMALSDLGVPAISLTAPKARSTKLAVTHQRARELIW
jgi:aspartokinase